MGARADHNYMAADLHFHLLPGVDDGPGDMAASLELARAAVADGTTTVVATPHVRPPFVCDVSELRERVAELRAALDAAGLELEVRRGGEVHHRMVGRLDQAELDSIAHGPPGSRWRCSSRRSRAWGPTSTPRRTSCATAASAS
jgi:protein-tyrosine phosphatase